MKLTANFSTHEIEWTAIIFEVIWFFLSKRIIDFFHRGLNVFSETVDFDEYNIEKVFEVYLLNELQLKICFSNEKKSQIFSK